MSSTSRDIRRFGSFELDIDAGQLLSQGRRVKLQPQPFRLLVLLTSQPGSLISRDDIRRQLWPDGTFVDFDQSVSFAVKQVRDALGDSATHPVYVETLPRQGYRFVAPVDRAEPPEPVRVAGTTTVHLQKAMWANIADLRLAEARQRRLTYAVIGLLVLLLAGLVYMMLK
jgi:DNA-binding winged helix-turn-helix (wHTH) protein